MSVFGKNTENIMKNPVHLDVNILFSNKELSKVQFDYKLSYFCVKNNLESKFVLFVSSLYKSIHIVNLLLYLVDSDIL